MAVDDVLLDAARAGGGPILRTYGWSPPAVSLGFGQRAHEAVDVHRCRELGIDVVRRPTGGRAVLHWKEITYSFHCAEGQGPAAHALPEACRILGECLAEGLRRGGVEVELAPGGRPGGRHGACFASASRWELTCGGRKLVGSAPAAHEGGAAAARVPAGRPRAPSPGGADPSPPAGRPVPGSLQHPPGASASTSPWTGGSW